MSHVSKETYKQMVAASKVGNLACDLVDSIANDRGDELYLVLERIVRKRGLVEDFDIGSDVYFRSYPGTKQTTIRIATDWNWYDHK